MAKHRNKKRAKLEKMRNELTKLKTLNYYHQPEDVKEMEEKIKMVEASL